MSTQIAALVRLQMIDNEILRRKKAFAALDSGAAARREADGLAARLETVRARLHELHTEQQDGELARGQIDAKQTHVQDTLYGGSVSDSRDLVNLQKEFEMLVRQQGRLDDRLLEVGEEVGQLAAQETELKDSHAAAEQTWQETVSKYEAAAERLRRELSQLERLRAQATTGIDKATLARYDFIRQRSGGTAVAPVVEDACGACHVSTSREVRRRLSDGENYAHCENCSRFLYMPQAVGAPA